MGNGTAGGLWCHQQWLPSWILPRIRIQDKTARNGNFLCFTWHINKRFAGFLSEDLLLLLKEGEKNMYFHPKLAWPPATFYVIFCNHSSRPSSNLPQNLREGWTNNSWKHQMLMFHPLGKNSKKPNGGMAYTPPPLVHPWFNIPRLSFACEWKRFWNFGGTIDLTCAVNFDSNEQ